MKLYYLTSASYALSNVALKRLKISRFSDLNDPFELLPVDLTDRAHRKALQNFKTKINESKGLICFSSTWENPVLWGHFGDKHQGMALGFEIDEKVVNEVIYSNSLIKIPVDPATKKAKPTSATLDLLLRTKFEDWRYENEWRIFFDLSKEKKEAGMYFCDFSSDIRLTEIILGPRCEMPNEKIEAMIRAMGLYVKVIKSRIAFRSFRVIEAK